MKAKFSGGMGLSARTASVDPGSGVDPTSLPNQACDGGVSLVAYLVGNPWPICHECKRHVYLVGQTGEWRHFV